MRFTYDLFYPNMFSDIKGCVRTHTGVRLATIEPMLADLFSKGGHLRVTDNLLPKRLPLILSNQDEFEGFRVALEQHQAWRCAEKESPIEKAVEAKHYKNYIDEMQWIDAMSKIPRFRDPVAFKAALELQIRKYMDRLGQKDDELQELLKAKWYLTYLCAYIKNGCKPILGKDMETILNDAAPI